MLSDELSDLVQKHKDVQITLKGNLVKVSGERITFEVAETFKAKSRSYLGTWWKRLAR